MKTEPVRGFKDYTGKEAEKRAVIKEIVKGIFQRYGFEPAETPVIELEEFVKSSGNEEDEAVSDIYKLKDKGKRNLALRYEFTFQLKRLMKNKKLPYKRFQIGPVFRDEPIKGNRLRQFISCDVDVLGGGLKEQADAFSAVKEILDKLKVESIIYVNNRKLLDEILNETGVKEKDKEQVIREIDKLDKLSKKEVEQNLEKYNAKKVLEVLSNKEEYFKKYSSYKEISELKKYCSYYGFNVIFAPYLARGLSYYTGTVFEVKSKKIKETIFGGGEYIFNNVNGFGFGVSIERLSVITNLDVKIEKYLVVSLNQNKKAIQLVKKLRAQGKNTSLYYGKPSKALEYANSYDFKKVIFVGTKEVQKKSIKIKNMQTGKERNISLTKIKSV
ncbi:MAG: histidine--tRNA ligase [Minisyncoccales bacterium]